MTVSEIRNNIAYNDRLIAQYSSERQSLEKQMEELEQLRSKFTNLQNSFGEQQEKRKTGLSRFSQVIVSNKIFHGYLNGMTGLLNGSMFNEAFSGLTTAKQTINRKIQELLDNLEDCEGRIQYRQSRRVYWQNQLQLALAEEES